MKLNIINKQDLYNIYKEELENITEIVLKNETNKSDFEVNLLITNNEEIKKYNNDYRNKNEPTDILAFEYGIDNYILGDIVISVEKIEEQSKTFKNSFIQEFYYIYIHGLLHLLGYTHEEKEKRKIMFEKQDKYFNMINNLF